ncbi:hypothetical protein [Novosphingobium mangrovi (ex Hu et al. 2023)]|uniref:Uncharacterized protein n=1 Tax=Novosphingobium mangrovi (ex Hu et al. 2023) TaxID=2930094 RepID=A0ABT0A8W6_9SPHN|nr:hypothetical protein [Novosphingobium mangrovi (ex Hu et al. 2023)]MCJ1959628.1 hypothetical protein [Novosphingobium mangrovi (ex Hu et al. 2023)]
MTKRREPLTYQHTLTKVAARIGWDRCAHICGVSERSVRNWSDPDCETEIRMIDAERLDRAYLEHGGECAPFHHLMTLRLELSAKGSAATCMFSIASSVAKESGEAIAALVAAAGSLDDTTRRAAVKEGEEAIAALTHAMAALARLPVEAA